MLKLDPEISYLHDFDRDFEELSVVSEVVLSGGPGSNKRSV
jgi:hypothetical protein